jgi:hypothetical protein
VAILATLQDFNAYTERPDLDRQSIAWQRADIRADQADIASQAAGSANYGA